MNKKNIIILFGTAFILGVIIGTIFADKDIKIKKLIKENNELKQEIIDYKWQLEQVPYIIESNKEEICK